MENVNFTMGKRERVRKKLNSLALMLFGMRVPMARLSKSVTVVSIKTGTYPRKTARGKKETQLSHLDVLCFESPGGQAFKILLLWFLSIEFEHHQFLIWSTSKG